MSLSTEVRRSACLTRTAVAILAPLALGGGYALAQRPSIITDITVETSSPGPTFWLEWDNVTAGTLGLADKVYQAENSTNDDNALDDTPSGFVAADTGGITLNSRFFDGSVTYEFFIGVQDGYHCQWYGVYCS